MEITKDLLKKWSACADGYGWFIKHFPQGGDVHAVGAAPREKKRYDDAAWLTSNVFTHFIVEPGAIAAYVDGDVKQTLKDVDGSPNSASGDYSKAASSGDSSKAEANGERTIAMVAGIDGKARAGINGAFALPWLDGNRVRIAVGVIGENADADVWYQVKNGELAKVDV